MTRPDYASAPATDLSNSDLVLALYRAHAELNAFHKQDENYEGQAGSPGEWISERIDEVETELKRRGVPIAQGETRS
jgi:hypothetical protein